MTPDDERFYPHGAAETDAANHSRANRGLRVLIARLEAVEAAADRYLDAGHGSACRCPFCSLDPDQAGRVVEDVRMIGRQALYGASFLDSVSCEPRTPKGSRR